MLRNCTAPLTLFVTLVILIYSNHRGFLHFGSFSVRYHRVLFCFCLQVLSCVKVSGNVCPILFSTFLMVKTLKLESACEICCAVESWQNLSGKCGNLLKTDLLFTFWLYELTVHDGCTFTIQLTSQSFFILPSVYISCRSCRFMMHFHIKL